MKNLPRKEVPTVPAGPPGSLAAALAQVPDPRQPYGWRPEHAPLPLAGLLQLTVAATLCGARSLYAIAQWAEERRQDAPELLAALGVPAGRRPCVATLHRVFKRLDVAAFEAALGAWLQQTGIAPSDPLAVDGKTLRGIHGEQIPGVHLVGAYAHEAGALLGQLCTAGKGQELAAAKALLRTLPLQGRLVTTDALLTQREVAEQVVASGGAYLLPVKDNQPVLRADLEAAFSPLAPDGP
jgi:DDE_Tnp_1-associated/Transposase DDE domain